MNFLATLFKSCFNAWRICAGCLFLLLGSVLDVRAIPEMDVTFYGAVNWGDRPAHEVVDPVIIEVYHSQGKLAEAVLGQRIEGYYILPVPTGSGAGELGRVAPGDILQFFINGIPLPAYNTIFDFPPGSDVELNLQVDLVTVTVHGDYGMGTPTGTIQVPRGSHLTLSVPGVISEAAGVEYRLSGFQGEGSVPAQGTDNPVSIVADEDTSVLWLWSTFYEVRIVASPVYGGSAFADPAPDSYGFYPEGTVLRLIAAPEQGFLFDGWSADLAGTNTETNLLVFHPRDVMATFARDSGEDGLPDEWQLANFSSFAVDEADPNADPDGDTKTNLGEWIAGTNPMDNTSVFQILDQRRDGEVLTVSWLGIRGRKYRIMIADSLFGSWSFIADETYSTANDQIMEAHIPIGDLRTLFVKVVVDR